MNDIVFLLINGITVACIYGLVAVAVSITWSALGLLNLSYGFIFSFAIFSRKLTRREQSLQVLIDLFNFVSVIT